MHQYTRVIAFIALVALLVFGGSHQATTQTVDEQSCNKDSGDVAIAACTRVIKANPKDANAYNNRGSEWKDKGEYDKAMADFNEAIRVDPKNAYAYYNRGNAWNAKGDYDKAIVDYNEAIRLNPKDAGAYYNRGLAWQIKRDYDKAIVDYNEAIELNPKDANAYNNRGNAWHQKGEYDKAMADFNEALRLNPKDAIAYNNRGYAWNAKGDYDKAMADFNEAIRLNPQYANAYNNRGLAWGNKGDYDKAIVDYNEAIRLNPKLAQAYYNRGLAWGNKGDYDKAIVDYNEAIRLNPQYADAYHNRGVEWSNKGDYDKAIVDYSEALRIDPKTANAAANLKSAIEAKAKQGSSVASAPIQQTQPAAQQKQLAITAAPIGRRVALIIGNARYKYAPALENPPRDAQVVAATLRNVGFQSVIEKTNLTREQTIQALRDFATLADSADWSVVYYSGHGVEFGGANYLIPIDAQLKADRDIDLETVNVGQVLNTIEGAKRLRLVILDACRSNPFASQMRRTMATRSLGKGLARIEPEAGTLVVYAAKHGEEALDGTGNNSPFVDAMVKRIQQRPGLEIRRLFDVVRDDVVASTNKKQQPFSYGSISGSEDFFFVR